MKKSRFAIITFSSTLLFFALACKKNSPPPDEPVTVKFSPEALEYVKLSPGKYLIYKDSASGVLDSVVVTQSLLEARIAPATVGTGYIGLDCPEYNYEFFTLALTQVNGNSIPWFIGRARSTECPYVNSDTAALFLREPDSYYAFSSVIEGNTDNYLIPSLVIEGKTYLNVIVHILFVALDINDPSYKKRTFYWAKGVGIIKRELIVPGGAIKTHTLLRHN